MSMAKAGALLIHYRAHFIKRLCQAAPAIHGDFPAAGNGLPYVMKRCLR